MSRSFRRMGPQATLSLALLFAAGSACQGQSGDQDTRGAAGASLGTVSDIEELAELTYSDDAGATLHYSTSAGDAMLTCTYDGDELTIDGFVQRANLDGSGDLGAGGQDSTGQDSTGQDSTGQDSTDFVPNESTRAEFEISLETPTSDELAASRSFPEDGDASVSVRLFAPAGLDSASVEGLSFDFGAWERDGAPAESQCHWSATWREGWLVGELMCSNLLNAKALADEGSEQDSDKALPVPLFSSLNLQVTCAPDGGIVSSTGSASSGSGSSTGGSSTGGSVISNASCQGTPTSCAALSESACGHVAGCDWAEECTGTSSPCFFKTSSISCNALMGCSWSYYSDDCSGFSFACGDMKSSSTCATQGCNWKQRCEGTPNPCSAYATQSTCEKQGCRWD